MFRGLMRLTAFIGIVMATDCLSTTDEPEWLPVLAGACMGLGAYYGWRDGHE